MVPPGEGSGVGSVRESREGPANQHEPLRDICPIPDWRVAVWAALLAVGLLSLFALLYMFEPAAW